MPDLLQLRPLFDEETTELCRLSPSRKVEARLRDRARMCWLSHEQKPVRAIVEITGFCDGSVRRWITRPNALGLAGLIDAPRMGRPPTNTSDQVGTVIATSLTPPDELGLPFGSWTLDRLVAYLMDTHGITMKRSRVGEILQTEGIRWRTQETWLGERVDPDFAPKKGAIITLYEQPPVHSVVICLDEMRPESAKSHPGTRLIRPDPTGEHRVRATQAADYGRRGWGMSSARSRPRPGAPSPPRMPDGRSPSGRTSSTR